jgi:hypothetical protein
MTHVREVGSEDGFSSAPTGHELGRLHHDVADILGHGAVDHQLIVKC